MPAFDQPQAIQLTAFHYCYRRFLCHSYEFDQKYYSLDNDPFQGTRKFWRCWPTGALFSWVGNGNRTRRDVCRRPRYCPWCLTRRVVQLYEHLHQKVLQHPEGKFLVLARRPIYESDWQEPYRLHQDSIGGAETIKEHVAYIRNSCLPALREDARRLGVRGGIVTYQLSPCLQPREYPYEIGDLVPSFEHEVALLGEVSFASEAEQARFENETGMDGAGAQQPVRTH